MNKQPIKPSFLANYLVFEQGMLFIGVLFGFGILVFRAAQWLGGNDPNIAPLHMFGLFCGLLIFGAVAVRIYTGLARFERWAYVGKVIQDIAIIALTGVRIYLLGVPDIWMLVMLCFRGLILIDQLWELWKLKR